MYVSVQLEICYVALRHSVFMVVMVTLYVNYSLLAAAPRILGSRHLWIHLLYICLFRRVT